MKRFSYIVKNEKGEKRKGVAKARSKEALEEALKDKEFMVIKVEEEKPSLAFKIPFIGGVSSKDKVVFTKQFATLLEAGVPMVDSLDLLIRQTNSRDLKKALKAVRRDVSGGISLSNSLAKHPDIFSDVYTAVVEAGETSGELPTVLEQLASELEQDENFSSKLKSAMIYPAFITLVLIGVMILMLVIVVPNLKGMFEGADMSLPLTTKILLGLSGFFVNYWWVVFLLAVLAGVGAKYYFSTEVGRRVWGKVELKLPVFGRLFMESEMARFSRIMSLLLGTGTPILKAIDLSAKAFDIPLFSDVLSKARKKVERGESLSGTLGKDNEFPLLVSQMVEVGEETGKISEILNKLSDYYEEETETRIDSISSMLEPVIVVVLGLGVGFVVFSIIVPLYQVSLAVL